MENEMNRETFGLATILKELETTITSASRVPLSGKVLVDGDAVLDVVDKIYAALPDELKQAQKVLEHSDKLLESVEGQSKRIINDARQQAEADEQRQAGQQRQLIVPHPCAAPAFL